MGKKGDQTCSLMVNPNKTPGGRPTHRNTQHQDNLTNKRNRLASLPKHHIGDSGSPIKQILANTRSSSTHKTTIPMSRPNRAAFRSATDPNPTTTYGHSIQAAKTDNQMHIFFRNIKGLSHTRSQVDYEFYFNHFRDLHVDIAGLSETNTAWQHPFLRQAFSTIARRARDGLSRTSYSSPSKSIDEIPISETFQAGGTLTTCLGQWTTTIFGNDIQDPTGLGRWSGLTIRGKHDNVFSIITAYRTCTGSRQSAPLGSVFHRETEYFRQLTIPGVTNPRHRFLTDMTKQIQLLQDKGHTIMVMMDANATLDNDKGLQAMLSNCSLTDLHRLEPAPSTFIGSAGR